MVPGVDEGGKQEMREGGKKLGPHTPYVPYLPHFLLTLFHSLSFQALHRLTKTS